MMRCAACPWTAPETTWPPWHGWPTRQAPTCLLVGMQMPPNYGQRYATDFAQLFKTVAEAEKTALLPFLLQGIADRPDAMSFFQADRIHPTAKAQAQMMDNVWAALMGLLR